MDEVRAFLQQARSDFSIFELLWNQDRGDVPECHPLHYLQMATEKLAKAASRAMNISGARRQTHIAFSKLPDILRRQDVAGTCGWKSFKEYKAFLDRAAPLFREIDELHPAVGSSGADGASSVQPNVEYPWQGRSTDGGEGWRTPALHDFGLLDRLRRHGEGGLMLVFIRRLMDRFDEVFK